MKKILVFLMVFLSAFLLSSCQSEIDDDVDDVNDVIVDVDDDVDDVDDDVDDDVIVDERFDTGLLVELDTILDSAGDIDNIYGITISIDGEIFKERYFNNNEYESENNIFSVTKSITSLLVGIAIDKGYIESVNQSISDYIDIDDYETTYDLSLIKIEHLLTMSAGLVWDSSNLSGEMISLRRSTDPLSLILERELGFDPGTQFNYSDGSAHLMSVILAEATGMSARDFAYENLLEPLGIEKPYWNADQTGVNIGGCDLFLSNSSLNIIGNLVLNKGIYDGVRIVSEEWIETSTENKVATFSNNGYGYYWWLSNKWGVPLISARGWGGQHIYVIPEFNMVITSSSLGSVADAQAHSQFDEIEFILVHRIIELFVLDSMEE